MLKKCNRCKKIVPIEVPHVACAKCREGMREVKRSERARYAEQGLCVCCGRPRVPGRLSCRKCLDRAKRCKSPEVHQALLEQNVCIQCRKGSIAHGRSSRRCGDCLDMNTKTQARYRRKHGRQKDVSGVVTRVWAFSQTPEKGMSARV